jgi:predicted transcriptional regulator of viral defense system
MKSITPALPRDHHFDYQFLLNLLAGYSAPRDKISRMIRNKEIIRIKKGIYVLSPVWGGRIDPFVLANVICGPSYVSLESALAYWEMIPEQVTETTSMTTKRTADFRTLAGIFLYRHIRHAAFIGGVVRRQHDTIPFLIASAEKALCDRIAGESTIRSMREIEPFLLESLRVDKQRLENLNSELLESVANVYRSPSVRLLAGWIRHKARK